MKNDRAGWLGIAGCVFILMTMPVMYARAEAPKLKVLTFNVWGIVGAEDKPLRAAAIAHKVAELDPDIVALEEAWVYRERKVLFDHLAKAGYHFKDWKYVRNLYGAGLLIITKGMIEQVRFEPYRVQGGAKNIEWLGGKGITYARIRLPWGPMDFFHTHAIARMTDVFDDQGNYIPGDPMENDRLLQMYQIDRFIAGQRGAWTRSLIAAGDYNVSPEMLEYRFLLALSGLENAFDAVNPGKNPSTYSTDNVFVTQECSRVDHVLYKNFPGAEGFGIKPAAARVEMLDLFYNPKSGEDINYSDHYALYAEFEVMPDKDAAAISPPGVSRLPVPCRACPLSGYKAGIIEVTAANLRAWQDLAIQLYIKAYHDQERGNLLLPPLAEIVAATKAATIKLGPEAQSALEEILQARYPESNAQTTPQTGK